MVFRAPALVRSRTREPGGTPLSEKIRALLLDAKHSEMVPFTELFLYMASRAQLVDEVIRPSLEDIYLGLVGTESAVAGADAGAAA